MPLPTSLGGVRVTFGAVDAPLLAIKDVRVGGSAYQQVTFQVPYRATAAPRVVQGEQSAAVPATPAPWGQFIYLGGHLAAQHAVDYRPVTFADPPRTGEWIILYGDNFGEVVIDLQSGVPAPTDRLVPLSTRFLGLDSWKFGLRLDNVVSDFTLEVGFPGLAPGTVGVYQFNVRMPDPLPRGPAWIYMQKIGNCGPATPWPICSGLIMDTAVREMTFQFRVAN